MKNKRIYITEEQFRNLVDEGIIREYLDKNLMSPLYKYLKHTRKKYSLPDFKKLYNDVQIGKSPYITTRQAFQNPQIFKNGWVLHFTNAPMQILLKGFKGIKKEYLEQIWRTYGKGFETDNEGYCFAYDANAPLPPNCTDYGKYALMFRVSGLKVTNLGDTGEAQVIFNSRTANLKDCYLIKLEIEETGGFDYDVDEFDSHKELKGVSVINPYTKKAVYKGKSVEDAVKWVETNYRQYSTASVGNNAHKVKRLQGKYRECIQEIVGWVRDNAEGECVVDEQCLGNKTYTCIIYNGYLPMSKFAKFITDMQMPLEFHTGGADLNHAYYWLQQTNSDDTSYQAAMQARRDLNTITIEYTV